MMPALREAKYCDLGYPRRKRQGGFTLVEVVVALAVLTLLMMTVLAALRVFGNTQSSLDKLADRIDEIRSVSSFLRDGLEATVPGSGGGSGLVFGGSGGGSDKALSYFKGNTNGFQWKARMVFGENYGGTFLVRVERAEDSLILQWQRPPEPIESATWDDRLSRVLVNQLQDLQISYRGEPGKEWQEHWEKDESPELVRVNIKAGDRYWPELIMSVQR